MEREIKTWNFLNEKEPEIEAIDVNNHGKRVGRAVVNKKKFKSRKKFAAVFFAGVLAVGTFGATHTTKVPEEPIGIETETENEVKATKYYTTDYLVKPGDNLYSIVASYADNNDINSYMAEIERINGINKSMLQIGSVITLVHVPDYKFEELNTGYNENFEYDKEQEEELLNKIEYFNEVLPDLDIVSTLPNVNKMVEVYRNTTNPTAKSNLYIYLNGQVRFFQEQVEKAESQEEVSIKR